LNCFPENFLFCTTPHLRDVSNNYSIHYTAISPPVRFVMKNIFDVLRTKEQDILRIRKEIDALRIASRLLTEDSAPVAANGKASQLLEMPDSDERLDMRVSEQPTA